MRVEASDIKELLGAPRFYPEEARKDLPAGVATGMAWTEMGGQLLFIEATLLPGGSGLTLTGQLGEVMQESARAPRALICGRTRLSSALTRTCSKATARTCMCRPERFRKTAERRVAITSALASL